MRRSIVFQTTCANKVPEVSQHFDKYGVETIHESNKTLDSKAIIEKYPKENIIAIINETSSLVIPGTDTPCGKKHLEPAEHLSILRVVYVKNNIVEKEKEFQCRTQGYIDLDSDPNSSKFGWDNIFFLNSCDMNYIQLAKKNAKISSRDICITLFIKDRLYYTKKIDLAFNPQEYTRAVDFGKIDDMRQMINRKIAEIPKMVDYGIVKMLNYSFANGIYFSSPTNRRIKLSWIPGILPIPFTRKDKDPEHEFTYFVHDGGHYAIRPDLIFTGNHSRLNYLCYITMRMMSEAITIVIADMVFTLAIKSSGKVYASVADRKITPLFDKLDVVLDTSNDAIFLQNLYKILQANVFYCLLGDDSYYKNLLKKDYFYSQAIIALEEYKKKYSQFFIQDYRWTENNYMQMVRQSAVQKQWYKLVQQLNLKYDLNLVSVDSFVAKLGLTEKDAEMDHAKFVGLAFDYIFENNVKRFFTNRNVITIEPNNLTKAFARYMCNQLYIFKKLAFYQKSQICENKIMDFLMKDSTTKIELSDIQRVRGYYKQYLEACQKNNFITMDDLATYDEIYPTVEPFIVDYDTEYPEPLDVVAKNILDRKDF